MMDDVSEEPHELMGSGGESVIIVIPARFASSRLPGKPLADICGKPMVCRVLERAWLVKNASRVLVATDDRRIFEAVRNFGGEAVMTRSDHPTGTDRLAEVLEKNPAAVVANIQGDEPLVRPRDIELLIEGMLATPSVGVGTLCHPMPPAHVPNPNFVKVVRAENGDALYFSRAPIPFARDADRAVAYQKHIGTYAYRADALRRFVRLPRPSIETVEQLEQLRFLAHGIRVRVWEVAETAPGVDTPESLEEVRRIFAAGQDAGACGTA